MNICEDSQKQFPLVLILDKKDAAALIEILNSAINQKPMHKRSNAFKLATTLDDNLPIFA